MQLSIYNHTTINIPDNIFINLLQSAERCLIRENKIRHSREGLYIELSLVDNNTIQSLNNFYYHKNRPTDVLSLSYFDSSMQDNFCGEMFISVPYAKKQAEKIGQPFSEELRFLFIHGLLHIFGYDHKKPREEEHMKQLTYKILGR